MKLLRDYGNKGKLFEDEGGLRLYITFRRSDRHFVRKYQGYGISKAIFDEVVDRLGADLIVVNETDTGRQLTVPASLWDKEGIVDELGGHEAQKFLNIHRFEETEPGMDP